jgi:hypothetical protein
MSHDDEAREPQLTVRGVFLYQREKVGAVLQHWVQQGHEVSLVLRLERGSGAADDASPLPRRWEHVHEMFVTFEMQAVPSNDRDCHDCHEWASGVVDPNMVSTATRLVLRAPTTSATLVSDPPGHGDGDDDRLLARADCEVKPLSLSQQPKTTPRNVFRVRANARCACGACDVEVSATTDCFVVGAKKQPCVTRCSDFPLEARRQLLRARVTDATRKKRAREHRRARECVIRRLVEQGTRLGAWEDAPCCIGQKEYHATCRAARRLGSIADGL